MTCRLLSRRATCSVLCMVVLLCQRYTPTLAQTISAHHDASPQEVATFAFDRHLDVIFLPVTTLGVTRQFVFDTGSSHHVLDNRFTTRLGRPIRTDRAATAGAPIAVNFFKAPKMLVGEIAVVSNGQPVVAIDFTRMSEVIGREVYGLLGASFLRERIVSLDFDHGIVRVFASVDTTPDSWGTPIPLHVDSYGQPHITMVAIGTDKRSFLLDTGMNGSVTLASSEFQRLMKKGMIDSLRSTYAMTAGGEERRLSGRLKTIRIGPFEHRSVIVHESSENKIGLQYLSRFRATLDIPRKRLYLAPGLSFGKTNTVNTSGLYLAWRGNRVVANTISKNSPAQRAGIIKGDLLLEINGIPATGTNFHRLRSSLRGKEGTEIRVTLLRLRRQHVVRLHLQRR